VNKTPPEAPSALPPRGAPLAARQSRFRGGRLVAAAAACVMGVAAAQGAEPLARHEPGAPQALAAPHYGDTLFHFYQDHTFTALTGLMVSQHFGRIAPHDDEAEVLRGGMLLAYGLHDEAATVFARLIENNTTPAVRNRAWYFLAQVRHQRGLNVMAEEALARVDAPLPGALEDERRLLQAQLLMAREGLEGQRTIAEEAAEPFPPADPERNARAHGGRQVGALGFLDLGHGVDRHDQVQLLQRRVGEGGSLGLDAHLETMALQQALHDVCALLGLVAMPAAPDDQSLLHERSFCGLRGLIRMGETARLATV